MSKTNPSPTRCLAWVLAASLLGCAGDDDDPGPSGGLGQPCIGAVFCNDDLMCANGICVEGMAGESGTGDGDGDGDPSSGDGDGSPGDGDPGSPLGLYEGPCLTNADCDEGLWCSSKQGRSWCAMDCESADACPADPVASAAPDCKFLDPLEGFMGPRQGCVLACTDESECPSGAQCFYSGLASYNWCGFLD